MADSGMIRKIIEDNYLDLNESHAETFATKIAESIHEAITETAKEYEVPMMFMATVDQIFCEKYGSEYEEYKEHVARWTGTPITSPPGIRRPPNRGS